jgi:hypothetical protein
MLYQRGIPWTVDENGGMGVWHIGGGLAKDSARVVQTLLAFGLMASTFLMAGSVTAQAASAIPGIDVRLREQPSPFALADSHRVLSARVLDPVTGGGVSGLDARLSIDGNVVASETTDELGQAEFSVALLPGTHVAAVDIGRPGGSERFGTAKAILETTQVRARADDKGGCSQGRDGVLYCWGADASSIVATRPTPVDVGEILDFTRNYRGDLCVILLDQRVECSGTFKWTDHHALSRGITEAKKVHLAMLVGCVAHNDGRVSCWGNGAVGRFPRHESPPDAVSHVVVPMPLVDDFDMWLGVDGTACGVTGSGDLYCWGSARVVPPQGSWTPVQIHGLPPLVDVELGVEHACAIDREGQVHCWGWNEWGQLGLAHAAPVEGFVKVPLEGRAKALALGMEQSCAIMETGHVSCWGRLGQLGNGSAGSEEVEGPVQVLGLSNTAEITAGYWHTCAQAFGGQISCWGQNFLAQIGDGTRHLATVPKELADPFFKTTVVVKGRGVVESQGDDWTCGNHSNGQRECVRWVTRNEAHTYRARPLDPTTYSTSTSPSPLLKWSGDCSGVGECSPSAWESPTVSAHFRTSDAIDLCIQQPFFCW